MKFSLDAVPFQLKFPLAEVGHWAGLYPINDDDAALAAGAKIRTGDYSRENLDPIVMWKSPRRIGLIKQNSDSEIEEALRLAVNATEPRSSFGVLMGLSGVGVPMASAILTAIDQVRYTIIDYRALEALNAGKYIVNINFYLIHYLPECKKLATDARTSLRVLDRAMWAWSHEFLMAQ